MDECSFTNQMVAGSVPVAVFLNSDIAPALNRMFLHIQETTECTFSLSVKKIKMIKTEIKMRHDKDTQKPFFTL